MSSRTPAQVFLRRSIELAANRQEDIYGQGSDEDATRRNQVLVCAKVEAPTREVDRQAYYLIDGENCRI